MGTLEATGPTPVSQAIEIQVDSHTSALRPSRRVVLHAYMLSALFWAPVFIDQVEATRPFSACVAFDDISADGYDYDYEYEFPLIAAGHGSAIAMPGHLPPLEWD